LIIAKILTHELVWHLLVHLQYLGIFNMVTRNIKYGNDFFKTLEKSNPDIFFEITYWDVWIAILLDNHFDNKWDDLINHLYKDHSHYNRNNCESMIAHINYLRDELSNKGLNPADIIINLDDDFLKKQEIKAKRKVIELSFQDKEKSKWMHNTPRNIFFEEALQGNWDILPVNPQKQAEALRKKFKKKTHYSRGQTHALEEKLASYIEKQEIKASLPKLFALYRAFLTVILENMDNIDDSYGVIGDLSISVFEKYLELDWRQLPIDANGYFTDIIKYVIWEDYGVTDGVYPTMFSKLTKSEIKEIELLLQTERDKLIKHHLTYQAENALTMLGSLYAKNYLFNKFIPIAKEMGTREWKRILVLSEAAEIKEKYEIASSVFDVAIKESGDHTEYLRKEYTKLKAKITKNKS
jgi:hypothetical protein